MSGLTLVSLFDGIAGFPLAFSRAGVRTVATVEIDKAAAGVAAGHFPDAHHFSDVTEVKADDLLAAGFDPAHGIVAAGWPCTDLSLAGLRLGLGGARSGLVGEVFRLLLGLQPRWFVLENVPGLLSSVCPCPGGGACDGGCADPHVVRGGACGRRLRHGRAVGPGRCMALHGGGMGTVLRRLGECGYGLAYRVLDAQHFGVPQRRRRVVIVGRLGDGAAPAEVLLEPARGGGDPAPGSAARAGAAGLADGGADAGSRASLRLGGFRRGRRGYRVDAETAAGGGLIPLAGSVTAKSGGADENDAAVGLLVPHVAAALTARSAKGTPTSAGDGFTLVPGPEPVGFDLAQVTSGQNRSNPRPGGPAATLAGTGVASVAYALRADPGGTGQGHNTNYVPAEVYQQHGSNVGPVGALRAGNGNVTGGVPFTAHALTAEGSDASEDGTGRGTPLVPVGFSETGGDLGTGSDLSPSVRPGTGGAQTSVAAAAVRRLTPVECERLQGYPDGWTATSDGRAQADAPRYRQLGNSLAVPVFVWVAERIVAVDGATP